MKLLRIWAPCLLFFALMAGVTVYAVNRDYSRLPQVELALAREEGNHVYTVPLSALRTDGEGRSCLFFVREEEGPWGKAYVCKRAFLEPLEQDPESGTARVAGPELSRYPIAGASDRPLAEGQRVRFAPEDPP